MHHELGSVAQSEYRDPQFKEFLRSGRGTFLIDAVRSAGEDDPLRVHFFDLIQRSPVGIDLAVHLAFPDAPCDQLIILTAEINDDHFFLLNIIHMQSSCAVNLSGRNFSIS